MRERDANTRLRVAGPSESTSRTRIAVNFLNGNPASTNDTMLSMIRKVNGAADSGATTIPVTAGRILRITAITVAVKAGAAAAAFAEFSLRINQSGAAVIGSQCELRISLGNTEATIGAARTHTVEIPDGIELSGTAQFGMSASAQAVTNVLNVSIIGYEYDADA